MYPRPRFKAHQELIIKRKYKKKKKEYKEFA